MDYNCIGRGPDKIPRRLGNCQSTLKNGPPCVVVVADFQCVLRCTNIYYFSVGDAWANVTMGQCYNVPDCGRVRLLTDLMALPWVISIRHHGLGSKSVLTAAAPRPEKAPRPAPELMNFCARDGAAYVVGAPIMSLKKCHSVPTKGQLLSDIMALF